MTDESSSSGAEDVKNLHLAAEYVCDAWYPVDSGVLENIQDRLYRGAYDKDRNLLIDDLKQDSALFLYCLRRLGEMLQQGEQAQAQQISPDDILKTADLQHFREALAIQAHAISTHHTTQLDEIHARCCERSTISATTAEALAQSHDVPGNDAYACALLRQLGLTLIAWNYPHVYRRVIASLSPGESPDALLQKMLGFSPQLLAISVAKKWNMAPHIIGGMQGACDEADGPVKSAAMALAKICSLGEAFAECVNQHPPRSERWQEALEAIEKYLGHDAVSSLQKSIRHNLRSYARKHPVLAAWQTTETNAPDSQPSSAPAAEPRRASPAELLELNLYIRRCGAEEQSRFRELYSKIDLENTREALEFLRDSVVPLFGFERGCIFLLDPDTMHLAPRLPLGSAKLSDYASVRFSSSRAAFDPIVAAFSSKTPTIEEKTSPAGNKLLYIACSLGELQRAGVLYLELGAAQARAKRGTNPLVAFKAIRHALGDILMLR